MDSVKHETTKIGSELTGTLAATIRREGRIATGILFPAAGLPMLVHDAMRGGDEREEEDEVDESRFHCCEMNGMARSLL